MPLASAIQAVRRGWYELHHTTPARARIFLAVAEEALGRAMGDFIVHRADPALVLQVQRFVQEFGAAVRAAESARGAA